MEAVMNRVGLFWMLIAVMLLQICAVNVSAQSSALDDWWKAKVKLDMRGVTFLQALEMLFDGREINYIVDKDIQNREITAVLKDIPRDIALKEICRASGANYTQEGEVITFRSSVSRMTSFGDAAQFRRDLANKTETQVIELNNTMPSEVAGAALRLGAFDVTASNNNKLIVSADPQTQKRIAELVKEMDAEPTLKKQVRIRLTLELTPSDRQVVNQSTENVGVDGLPTLLEIMLNQFYQPDTYRRTDIASNFLTATVVPSVASDGIVTVSGNGRFNWYLDAPSLANRESISKSFQINAAIAPGKEKVITAGAVAGMSREVDFKIKILATIEPEMVRVPVNRMMNSYPGAYSPGQYDYQSGANGASYPWTYNNQTTPGMNIQTPHPDALGNPPAQAPVQRDQW